MNRRMTWTCLMIGCVLVRLIGPLHGEWWDVFTAAYFSAFCLGLHWYSNRRRGTT